ncbi:MAG: glucose starvation-inducible protein B [Burkholderiales bacterium]|nr:glucose starvation-inducible protein B [Burkholderiales bacterium]
MAQDTKSGSSGTSNRGFASMDPALQREIASKGGRSVPPEERSFSKDRALAAEAGRKGGEASHGGRRPGTQPGAAGNVAAGAGLASGGGATSDRARASEAGRKGGSH